MGCGSSSAAFNKRFDDLCRSIPFVKWNEMFEALQLRKNEIKQLYKIFWKADLDGGGTIDLVELLTIVDLERTPFTERIFSIFDEDDSGKIDFGEFVLALWNYCTLTKFTLAIFAFDLYDRDNTGILESKDLEMMLKDVYGKESKKNYLAKQILKELEDLNGKMDAVDVDAFLQFSTSHQYLLFPAFQLQLLLRTKIMGVSFWETHGQRRMKLSDNKYVKLEDFLTLITKKDFRGADGWLAPKGKSSKDRGGSKGDRIAKNKSSNELEELFGADFSAPTAAIIPKRRPSKNYGQGRRPSRDYSQGVGSPFVSPRPNGSQIVSPRGDNSQLFVSPRGGGAGGAQFVSPRGGGAGTGSQFVSPRSVGGGTACAIVSPRQGKTRCSFVSPRGDNPSTPAISELEELITKYGDIPTANTRRKSVAAPSPFKAGVIAPEELLAESKAGSGDMKEFEANTGPVNKNKKRRGSI